MVEKLTDSNLELEERIQAIEEEKKDLEDLITYSFHSDFYRLMLRWERRRCLRS